MSAFYREMWFALCSGTSVVPAEWLLLWLHPIVLLMHVWEVRIGQWTKKGFERFPYEELEERSFSLIYEQERS